TASRIITQATDDGVPLEIGKSIEKEIVAGQTDSYLLPLTQGQFVRVVVEQKGIEVAVVLLGPDGKKLEEVNSPCGIYGPESLSFIATTSGSYRVQVHPLIKPSYQKKAPPGRYEIKIADLRIATEQDQKQVIAEKTCNQGHSLRKEGTAESYGKAIEKYEEVLR